MQIPANANRRRLAQELAASGIEFQMGDDLQIISGDASQAAAIVSAHDPTPTRAERLEAIGLTEEQAAFRLVQVRGQAAPAWARSLVAHHLQQIEAALQ